MVATATTPDRAAPQPRLPEIQEPAHAAGKAGRRRRRRPGPGPGPAPRQLLREPAPGSPAAAAGRRRRRRCQTPARGPGEVLALIADGNVPTDVSAAVAAALERGLCSDAAPWCDELVKQVQLHVGQVPTAPRLCAAAAAAAGDYTLLAAALAWLRRQFGAGVTVAPGPPEPHAQQAFAARVAVLCAAAAITPTVAAAAQQAAAALPLPQ